MLKKCETHSLHLENINYDTGKKILPCEYTLVDDTYKKLMLQLPLQPVEHVNLQLRQNILDFFKSISPNEKNVNEEKKCSDAVAWLKSSE
jgi:hypothetical protein